MQRGTQGHVAERHGPTRGTCGIKCRGHVVVATRVHADARGGATWREGWQVKGPRVSGPWLEYWGGNAFALCRPTLYMRVFPLFLLCGTMFPRKLSFAGDVATPWASDTIAKHPSCELGSTRSSIKHVRLKRLK